MSKSKKEKQMNEDKIRNAEKLFNSLKVTEAAISKLESKLEKIDSKKKTNKEYEDGMYNLYITEYGDGSGFNIDLCRYLGNVEIISIIKDTLYKQHNELVSQLKDITNNISLIKNE